uniref:Uncharacterized protein LOC114347223 isoform X2 n=1 Tax=Diabrotica virgifera virgifera TaxID=50390 RepID=A0A6P7GVH8_DIAVI
MNHNSRGRKILELLKSSANSSAAFTESNNTQINVLNEKYINRNALSFDDEDESDRDKSYDELLKSSATSSTTFIEANNTQNNEVLNEDHIRMIRDALSFDEEDVSDRDQSYDELLKSSATSSTAFTDSNHTQSNDVLDEEHISDALSFNEEEDDGDKSYEPATSATDSSDDSPSYNEVKRKVKYKSISNQIGKKRVVKKTYNTYISDTLSFNEEEDDGDKSDEPAISAIDPSDDSPSCNEVKRKVKYKSICTQIGRKRVVHTSEWACNIQKRKYSAGEEYVSKKGKVVPARIMKPPCSCRLKCFEKLLQNNRQEIFNAYWSQDKGTDIKRQFIFSCLEKHSTVRSRKRDPASNKSKENTLHYYFTTNGTRIRVCKLMFLNTLSISNTVVVNVLKNIKPGGIVKSDQRGKQIPANKTHEDTIESVIRHISSFPTYCSHYTREKSDMKYLGTHLNVEKMYELYIEDCNNNDFNPMLRAKKWLYYDVFNKKFKLTFKPPEIDTCDTCDSFQAKLKNNLTPDEKKSVEEEHNRHLDESKLRYDLKSKDTKKANNTIKVLTGDLQKCLPSPLVTNCISLYKRKLWTLNYTLYDSSDSSVHCIMWDESKGARGGNEIGSGLLKWADTVIPGSEIEEIILWSDNCYGQNKNVSLIMCFFWILNKYPQVKMITQKFLLKGHTHMEADTVHALIDRKRKKHDYFNTLGLAAVSQTNINEIYRT